MALKLRIYEMFASALLEAEKQCIECFGGIDNDKENVHFPYRLISSNICRMSWY